MTGGAPVDAGDPVRAELGVVALGGIGEVRAGDDLAALVLAAVEADPAGPLRDGDVLVVTSKVVSKSEGRAVPAAAREDVITAASVHTLARRGPTRIVRTRAGLVLAAAGVDSSNVEPGEVLLLPADADASAARLRDALRERTGRRVGVVVSDTLGRAWRVGQTDLAIGSAGVRVVEDYAGRTDPYGNDLRVTAVALADELAGAADLVKTKLAGRPVALVRGLAHLVVDDGGTARDLIRPPGQGHVLPRQRGGRAGDGARGPRPAGALRGAARPAPDPACDPPCSPGRTRRSWTRRRPTWCDACSR